MPLRGRIASILVGNQRERTTSSRGFLSFLICLWEFCMFVHILSSPKIFWYIFFLFSSDLWSGTFFFIFFLSIFDREISFFLLRTCIPLKVRTCIPLKVRTFSPLKARACSPLKAKMHSPLKAMAHSPLKAMCTSSQGSTLMRKQEIDSSRGPLIPNLDVGNLCS